MAVFLVPAGATLSVALRPAATLAVAVVSLIAFVAPLMFTVPVAVAMTWPAAGAVTFVAIDSLEPLIRWRLSRAIVVAAAA